MNRVVKWLGIVLGVLVGLLLVAAAGVYIQSHRILTRVHEVPLTDFSAPITDSIVAVGVRLGTIRGCNGCHEGDLGGGPFFDDPSVAVLPAPNLTTLLPAYSDAELYRAIRHGVARDGRGLLAMPSTMFYHLSDDDIAAIIAWARSQPVVDREILPMRVGPMGRLGLVIGQFNTEADRIDHDAPRLAPEPGDTVRFGAYLARTICTECHGLDLRGEGGSPSLAMVAGFTEGQFSHLLYSGVGLGGRELGLMAGVARSRFSHMTAYEHHAVYRYLQTLATDEAATPAAP
ncbi:MAG: cytochrome c [Gemmatimonadales bacterium]